MNWIASLIPDSVVVKIADSLLLKYVTRWLGQLAGGAMVAYALGHHLVSQQQVSDGTQQIIVWVGGTGILLFNQLLVYLLHGKNQDNKAASFNAGLAAQNAEPKSSNPPGQPLDGGIQAGSPTSPASQVSGVNVTAGNPNDIGSGGLHP